MQFFLGGLIVVILLVLCALSFAFGTVTGTYLLFMMMEDSKFEELIQLRKKNRN